MAAEALSIAGHRVVVADAMPTVGRKFLMAGKSGLNLTKDEPQSDFEKAFDARSELAPILSAFGPKDVARWAQRLGQPVFTGSTGRVFPKAMKASPLLRAWLARLVDQGVDIRTRWRWTGWDGGNSTFETPTGRVSIAARTTILAMGGSSWKRLGSDGVWAGHLLDFHVAAFRNGRKRRQTYRWKHVVPRRICRVVQRDRRRWCLYVVSINS